VDFSKFEGTEYSADETLSAEMFDILNKSDSFYMEARPYGSDSLMKMVISDEKIMVGGTDADEYGVSKIVVEGEKAYVVIDEEKTVLVASSEGLEEITEFSEITTGRINFDASTYVVSEITIEGEKYYVEAIDNSDDLCMLYDEGKKLHLFIVDRSAYHFLITDEIPEGAFDIPSDYEKIDMTDME